MSVALNQLADYKGKSNYTPPMASISYEVSLPGGSEKTLNVPKGKRCCIISATGNYVVAADNTASMPSDSNFTQTFSELNKSGIWLYPSDPAVSFPPVNVLHFNSNDAILMTVSFFD